MKTIVNVPSRQNTMRELRDYLMIALGMVLYGIGWTVFLLPNDITTGGVPGNPSYILPLDFPSNIRTSPSIFCFYCLPYVCWDGSSA